VTITGWLFLVELAGIVSLFAGFNLGVATMCVMSMAARDKSGPAVACPLEGAPGCPLAEARGLDHPANDPMEGG